MAELDYYKVLGIPNSSNAIQIKRRYQQLAKQYHPDHQGDESSMVIINRAYEVLSNSTKRLEYDHRRILSHKRRTAAHSTQHRTQTSKPKTYKQAKTPNKDKITIAIFLIIFLVALLGFR